MGLVKRDFPPLLAPGRHCMSLSEIEFLCVRSFQGPAFNCRERLFYALEMLVQELLMKNITCDMIIDGSFFTEKPDPDDVDVIILYDHSLSELFTGEQRLLVDAINTTDYIAGVQAAIFPRYPREHPMHGSALDMGRAGEAYGLEHNQCWLKGYAVLRFGETDVGLRICR